MISNMKILSLLALSVAVIFADSASDSDSDSEARHPESHIPHFEQLPPVPIPLYHPLPQHKDPYQEPSPYDPYQTSEYSDLAAYLPDYVRNPPPDYQGQKCTTKEWSSETELCLPQNERRCEDIRVRVRKVRDPQHECSPSNIPRCKLDADVHEMRLCNSKVLNVRATLYASLYEMQMVVRCNTHYETTCEDTAYGYGKKCYNIPVRNCYDVPHLMPVDMPIRVSVPEIKEDCRRMRIPTPRTLCWEEERNLCPEVPELTEKERTLRRCDFQIGQTKCNYVKLTIPTHVCIPEEKYYPYPIRRGYAKTS